MHFIRVLFLFVVIFSSNVLVLLVADPFLAVGAFSIGFCSEVFDPNRCCDWLMAVELWTEIALFNSNLFS